MCFSYQVQERPEGLAQAFVLGRSFIGGDDVCVVLGDNIFYGAGLPKMLKEASASSQPTVFGYRVSDPERYGVVTFDAAGQAVSLEEKPSAPQSNYAVVGLYFYPNDVVALAEGLTPSARGEYEISDINKAYLAAGRLRVKTMGRGYAWLDTGTHRSLADATNFVRAIIDRQGLQLSCIEEIAWHKGWIDDAQLARLAEGYGASQYGCYLKSLVKQGS
jgi:glucose-1-phosphate thymidylyltransferase